MSGQPGTVRRTQHGLRLVRRNGEWHTEDGRYAIGEAREITTCDEPHPMRISRADIEAAREQPYTSWGRVILDAVAQGKRGYLCDGDEHDRVCGYVIVVGDNQSDELFNTVDAAWKALAELVRKREEVVST